MNLLIITGMSGAGKSLCVKYFEDIGYFCVDNLPPSLIPKFTEVILQSKNPVDKIALIVDIRGGTMFLDLFPALQQLQEIGIAYKILFLDATDAVLVKRFKETRRQHLLSPDGRIAEGIEEERRILQAVKDRADYIIDTSSLTPRQLKEEITRLFVEGRTFKGLIVHIVSFGFKHGIPMDCDLVFDVRFIPNPYYVPELKPKSGLDPDVSDYVLSFPESRKFLTKLNEMITFLIPYYVKEGKTQLVIGIGCTGGRHRSVAVANRLAELQKDKGSSVVTQHRDIDKGDQGG
ncbi:MAG TPA: RNase adapter RapZ [Thermoclostridium caenicola]|uniref:RNase adapter RapZ n=1 Tax=Thermoclostridium caenicola TaxID=659425 RepID=UPI002BB0E0F3|nr:RNase adapter RapZ [Thermoclostridium caenicola]HOK42505.1 RNase adapter RapZ [Thermoclostridium caenicola]HPO76416.1 RNase adapter RapZ [Thermoclostridium caenicola]